MEKTYQEIVTYVDWLGGCARLDGGYSFCRTSADSENGAGSSASQVQSVYIFAYRVVT
jgi:hypothetical protein